MNKAILMGRLTRDPEIRYSQGAQGTAVCRYSIAVNRSYKKDGEPDADFFNIVAFGSKGEFASKYFKKGQLVAVVGEIRNGSFTDKDGNKRYTTDIVVSEQHFAESRASSNQHAQGPSPDFAPANAGMPPQQMQQNPSDGFMPDESEDDEDLPF